MEDPIATKRPSPRPSGKPAAPASKQRRVQLHLDANTVERLGVHAALVNRDKSQVVNAILLSYLGRYGKGKEIFAPVDVDPA